jgi:hypothetical protein
MPTEPDTAPASTARDVSRAAAALSFLGSFESHSHRRPGPSALPLVTENLKHVTIARAESDGSAIAVDGQMIDKPVVDRARAILADAQCTGSSPTRQP